MVLWWIDTDSKKTKLVKDKPVPISFFPPQIFHWLAWDNWGPANNCLSVVTLLNLEVHPIPKNSVAYLTENTTSLFYEYTLGTK